MSTLHIKASAGCSVTVERQQDDSIAESKYLYDGDTIYEGDQLKITCKPNVGYRMGSMTTGTGLSFGSTTLSGNLVGTVTCSSSDFTLIVTTVLVKYTLYISAGTGSTISVKRTSSPRGGGSIATLGDGDTIYYLDELKISCEASNGYRVTQLTVNNEDFTSGGTYTVQGNDVRIKSIAANSGLVYIDNGAKTEAYQCFIDNGSSWDQYMPYIDNGSGFDLCN